MNLRLRRELHDLALVAGGAIPGALLRWQLELVAASATNPGLRALTGADLLANLIGCLLIGLLLAQPPRRARLYLWAASVSAARSPRSPAGCWSWCTSWITASPWRRSWCWL